MNKKKTVSRVLSFVMSASLVLSSFTNTAFAETKQTQNYDDIFKTTSLGSIATGNFAFDNKIINATVEGGNVNSSGHVGVLNYKTVSGDFTIEATLEDFQTVPVGSTTTSTHRAFLFATKDLENVLGAAVGVGQRYEKGVLQARIYRKKDATAGSSFGSNLKDLAGTELNASDVKYFRISRVGTDVKVEYSTDKENYFEVVGSNADYSTAIGTGDVNIGLFVSNATANFKDLVITENGVETFNSNTFGQGQEITEPEIEEVASIVNPDTFTHKIGQSVSLPAKVTANLTNGKNKQVDVKWETSNVDFTKVGTVEVLGAVEDLGKTFNVTLKVNVIGIKEIKKVSDVKIYTGMNLSLPSKVTVVYENDTTGELAVAWDTSNVDATKVGTVEVQGTVEYTNLKATVNVVIEEEPATVLPDGFENKTISDSTNQVLGTSIFERDKTGNGIFTIRAEGGRVFSGGDFLEYSYLPNVTGDFTAQFTIKSVKEAGKAYTNDSAVYLMIKTGLEEITNASANYSIYYKPSSSGQVEVKAYRRGHGAYGGGGSTGTAASSVTVPDTDVKILIERVGNVLQSYYIDKDGGKTLVHKQTDLNNGNPFLGDSLNIGIGAVGLEAQIQDFFVMDGEKNVIYASTADGKLPVASIVNVREVPVETVVVGTSKEELAKIMPRQVEVIDSYGNIVQNNVTWDSIDVSTVGKKVVTGTVEGTSIKAKMTLNVVLENEAPEKLEKVKVFVPQYMEGALSNIMVHAYPGDNIDEIEYRINGGLWKIFTGYLEVSEDCVIEIRGKRETQENINGILVRTAVGITDIAEYEIKGLVSADQTKPVIGVSTTEKAMSVDIYGANLVSATSRQYRINGGSWRSLPAQGITVYENGKVEVRADQGEPVAYEITNIVSKTAQTYAGAKTIYVSTTGLRNPIDNGVIVAGSQEKPFYYLKDAVLVAKPGDTIIVENGEYFYNEITKVQDFLSGTADARITVKGIVVDGKKPVLNFKGQTYHSANRGVEHYANYWDYLDLEFTKSGDNGMSLAGSYNTIERCEFSSNRDTGLQLSPLGGNEENQSATKVAFNKIINSDSYLNYDYLTAGGNADGYAVKLFPGAGNTFDGCRAWANSDDGWDFFQSNYPLIINNSWTWDNGVAAEIGVRAEYAFGGNGNGFKIGGGAAPVYNYGTHLVRNSISFNNPEKGFDRNNTLGSNFIVNNLGFNNKTNYGFARPSAGDADKLVVNTFINNVSIEGKLTQAGKAEILGTLNEVPVEINNSWNLDVAVTVDDYITLEKSAAVANREADGSLPNNGFGTLKADSNLRGRGVKVGELTLDNTGVEIVVADQTYEGYAPNVGPYRSSVSFTYTVSQNEDSGNGNDSGAETEGGNTDENNGGNTDENNGGSTDENNGGNTDGNNSGSNLPQTGSPVDASGLIVFGITILGAGLLVRRKSN